MSHRPFLIAASGLFWPLAPLSADAGSSGSVSAAVLWSAQPLAPIARPAWSQALENQALAEADRVQNEPIPDHLLYTQKNADLYGRKILALVTAARSRSVRTDRLQAQRILLALARDFNPQSAYVTSNYGLDFSVSLPPFVYAYKVLLPSLAPEDQKQISDFLLAGARRLKETAYGSPSGRPEDDLRRQRSNIRAWQNAAVAAVGFTIGGAEGQALAQWAIQDPQGGFLFQMTNSILPDGMVGEGSWAYHVYSLLPWTTLALIAESAGVSVLAHGNADDPLIKAFRVAILSANRSEVLPSLGDGRRVSLCDYGSLFFLATLLSSDAVVRQALTGARTPSGFQSETALVNALGAFAAPSENPTRPEPLAPLLLPDAGVATLRAGTLFVQFESSQPRSHANASRNAIIALDDGDHMLSGHESNGSRDYADPVLNSYRRGLGYDTLLVDHEPARSAMNPNVLGGHGRITYWDPGPDVQLVEGQTSDSYSDPTLNDDRVVELVASEPMYVLDNLLATSSSPHQDTAVLHGPDDESATVHGAACSAGPASPAPAYALLTGWQSCGTVSGPITIEWPSVQLVLTADPLPVSLEMAAAPGVESSHGSLALATRTGPMVTFTSLWNPSSQNAKWLVTTLTVSNPSSVAERMEGPTVDWHVVVFGSPGRTRATNPSDPREFIECYGKHADARISGGRIQVWGQAAALRFKASPIQSVMFNGHSVPFASHGQYVDVSLSARS